MNPMDYANEVAKQYKLPHFFKVKLRVEAKRASTIKDEVFHTIAQIYAEAAAIAKKCNCNVVEVHKYSDMDSDAQLRRFPQIGDRTGNMPNPLWQNAIEYAAYKTHRRDVKVLKS